jgi:hypothetical protein
MLRETYLTYNDLYIQLLPALKKQFLFIGKCLQKLPCVLGSSDWLLNKQILLDIYRVNSFTCCV